MSAYEKIRQRRIEENNLKMAAFGIKRAASQLSQLNKSSKKLNKEMHPKGNSINDTDEYTPVENAELNSSNDENEIVANKVKLRSSSKKVSNTSSMSMSDLVKIRHSDNKKEHLDKEPQAKLIAQSKQQPSSEQIKSKKIVSTELNLQQGTTLLQSVQNRGGLSSSENAQVRVDKSTQRKLPFQNQQGQEDVSELKSQHRKVTIAPGSMSAYLQIKTNLKQQELRKKQNEALVQKLSLQRQELQTSKSKFTLGHDLEEEYENSMSLSDCDLEQEREEDADFSDGVHFGNDDQLEMQIDPFIEKDQEDPSTQKQKRTRGPTVCKDVLEWTLDDRKLIILNGRGEPIGPDKKTVDKFTRFIGTLSRNSSLAPLNKISWHYVLDKDNIWNYVKTKYIISEEGKDPILARVGKLWRKYKCYVKSKHFSAYDNDGDRLKHAPKTIPRNHFTDLLKFWNLDIVQEESKKKQEHSKMQMDRHTMGPMSFARKQYELQQKDAEKKPPSQACLYKETRKRKADNKYKTPFEPIQSNIDKMEEVQLQRQVDGDTAYREVMRSDNSKNHMQLRKCSVMSNGKSKRVSVGGMIIPDEYLQPLKDQIVKDTVGELMKTFKQQLKPETFADISQTLGASPPIPDLEKDEQRDNEQNLSRGINDQEYNQDQEDDEVE